MPAKSLIRYAVLFSGLFAVMGVAEEKKEKPAIAGNWTKKEGQVKIEFTGKDTMKIFPHGDKADFTILCGYTLKDGVVKAKITELEGNAELKEKAKNRIPPGMEFSFHWKVTADTASLENIEGKDSEILKSHLEGEYSKKTD